MNRPRSFRSNREPSIADIRRDWQELQRSGKPVTKQAITDIASQHHFTWGKWLFFVNTGVAVDDVWRKVAKAVYKGTIPSVSAKVSPVTPGKPTHLICVYNDNFTDREEVMACEKALRGLDLQYVMHYKPDIYTDLNIYYSNPWSLRPTLYTSTYDKIRKTSQIKTN